MNIRRRNNEHLRAKRNSKKFKCNESFPIIVGDCFKNLAVWALLLMSDYLTNFRFELLWSGWMFLRMASQSFHIKGLAAAVLLAVFVIVSDVIFYILLPTSLVCLLGSSVVWFQASWQSDRASCTSTLILCSVFLLTELAIRPRETNFLLFGFDICRPFAAHCIGFPLVSIGFYVKSVVTLHFQSRRRRSVETQNMTFFSILEDAIPRDLQHYTKSSALSLLDTMNRISVSGPTQSGLLEKDRSVPSLNAASSNSCRKQSHLIGSQLKPDPFSTITSPVDPTVSSTAQTMSHKDAIAGQPSSHFRKQIEVFSNQSSTQPYIAAQADVGPVSKTVSSHNNSNSPISSASMTNSTIERTANEVVTSSERSNNTVEGVVVSSCSCTSLTAMSSPRCTAASRTGVVSHSKMTDSNGVHSVLPVSASTKSTTVNTPLTGTVVHKPTASKNASKDEYTLRLESEIRQLRADIQSLRSSEVDLRSQVQQLLAAERAHLAETSLAQQESESLNTKLGILTERLQSDGSNLQLAEKRLADERNRRQVLEQQLAQHQQTTLSRQVNVKSRKDVAVNVSEDGEFRTSRSKTIGDHNISDGGANRSGHSARTNNNNNSSNMCADGSMCAVRLRELQAEVHSLVEAISLKDEQLLMLKDDHWPTLSVNGSAVSQHSSSIGGDRSSKGVCLPKPVAELRAYRKSKYTPAFVTCASGSTATVLATSVSSGRTAMASNPSDHALDDLLRKLNNIQNENQRLRDILKSEDKMKQELLTAFHSSLKQVTDLNTELTNKEYRIVELNMQLEGMNQNRCSSTVSSHFINPTISSIEPHSRDFNRETCMATNRHCTAAETRSRFPLHTQDESYVSRHSLRVATEHSFPHTLSHALQPGNSMFSPASPQFFFPSDDGGYSDADGLRGPLQMPSCDSLINSLGCSMVDNPERSSCNNVFTRNFLTEREHLYNSDHTSHMDVPLKKSHHSTVIEPLLNNHSVPSSLNVTSVSQYPFPDRSLSSHNMEEYNRSKMTSYSLSHSHPVCSVRPLPVGSAAPTSSSPPFINTPPPGLYRTDVENSLILLSNYSNSSCAISNPLAAPANLTCSADPAIAASIQSLFTTTNKTSNKELFNLSTASSVSHSVLPNRVRALNKSQDTNTLSSASDSNDFIPIELPLFNTDAISDALTTPSGSMNSFSTIECAISSVSTEHPNPSEKSGRLIRSMNRDSTSPVSSISNARSLQQDIDAALNIPLSSMHSPTMKEAEEGNPPA